MPDSTTTTSRQIADLPPRTWRRWWRERPGWLKILGRTLLVLAVAHVVLGIRMIIGWQEDQAITHIRQQGGTVQYSWEKYRTEPFPGYSFVMSGLRGRSRRNVVVLVPAKSARIDAELPWMAASFPNLEGIDLTDAEISANGLAALQQCPELFSINFWESNLDDDSVAALVKLKQLKFMDLTGTRITDAALESLQQIKSLKFIGIQSTDVTMPAIQAWRSIRRDGNLRIVTNLDDRPFLAVIRWSDGRQTAEFPRPYTLTAQGPLDETEPSTSFTELRKQAISDHWSLESLLPVQGNGDYLLSLSYHGVEAAPVRITVVNGKLTPERVEFRMPVTKAEALNAATP